MTATNPQAVSDVIVLRRLVEASGIQQAELARELGVARSTLCGWLRSGDRVMPARRREQLAAALERRARLITSGLDGGPGSTP